MKPAHSIRPLLLAVLLFGAFEGLIGQAHAANPIDGRWVAQVPGGRVSYYHFHPATQHTRHFDKGRFDHVFVGPRGREVILHGTYTLHHFGQRGRLQLQFDNGLRVQDVEHSGGNWLQLRHVGRGVVMTYSRIP
jgi:hypothetical protein